MTNRTVQTAEKQQAVHAERCSLSESGIVSATITWHDIITETISA
jgi:hypothetical protein